MDDIAIEKAQKPEESAGEDYGAKTSSKSLLIIIVVLVGMALLSVVGFSLYNKLTAASVVTVDDLHQENLNNQLDEKEGYLYNGFSFVHYDGLWWTIVKNAAGENLKIPLRFGPKDLEDISITGKLDPAFSQQEDVYLAINPNTQNKYYTVAISELSLNLAQGLHRTPVGSCTEENGICENRTIVNCETAQGKPVIELALNDAGGNTIQLQGTCIKLSGNDIGIVKSVDRLLYQWYKVMK